MAKWISFAVLYFVGLTGPAVFAQTEVTPPRLQKVCISFSSEKCGFIDSVTKLEVIPRRYKYVSDFSDGLALFSKNDRAYGFLNSHGEEVIPAIFDYAMDFSEGLATVRFFDKIGFIDKTGKWAIEPKFDLAGSFYHGYAEVFVDKKAGVIDHKGNYVVEPQFSRITHFAKDIFLVQEGDVADHYYNHKLFLPNLNSEYGLNIYSGRLYSLSKGWISKSKFNFARFENEGRGLVWASPVEGIQHGKDERPIYGLMRIDGSWQIEPQFISVNRLNEDRAIATRRERSISTDKYKFFSSVIDLNGVKILIDKEWNFQSIGDDFIKSSQLTIFKNGFSIVEKEYKEEGSAKKKFAMINRSGQIVTGKWYSDMRRSLEDVSIARIRDEWQWKGLTLDGHVVADPNDGVIASACSSGIKVIIKSDMLKIVDKNNTDTLPQGFIVNSGLQDIKLRCLKPTIIRGELKNRSGYTFIDLNGSLLNNDFYNNVTEFNNNGFAIVRKKEIFQEEGGSLSNKFAVGIIDKTGRYTAKVQFDFLRDLGDNRYYASKNYRKFYIDQYGNEIPEPKALPSSSKEAGLKCFNEGWAIRAQEVDGTRRWGIVDSSGDWIVQPHYRAINCTVGDTPAIVWGADDSKKQWCPIKTKGAVSDLAFPCRGGIYSMPSNRLSHLSLEPFAEDRYEDLVLWTNAQLNYSAGFRFYPPISKYTAGVASFGID